MLDSFLAELERSNRAIARYPPDELDRHDLLLLRISLLNANNVIIAILSLPQLRTNDMTVATMKSIAAEDLDHLADEITQDAQEDCKRLAISLAEGGATIDRRKLTDTLSAAGWTMADLQRHVRELRDRKAAIDGQAKADAIESGPLLEVKAELGAVADEVAAERESHRKRLEPLAKRERELIDRRDHARQQVRDLRSKIQILHSTMAPEVRAEFDRLSDRAVRSQQRKQGLEQEQPRREREAKEAAQTLAAQEAEAARVNDIDGPLGQSLQFDCRRRLEAAKQHLEAAERRAGELAEAIAAANSARLEFEEFQAGPMLDWRAKKF